MKSAPSKLLIRSQIVSKYLWRSVANQLALRVPMGGPSSPLALSGVSYLPINTS